MFQFPLTGLVTLFCLLVLFWVTVMVGRARGKHGVKVPRNDRPRALHLCGKGAPKYD